MLTFLTAFNEGPPVHQRAALASWQAAGVPVLSASGAPAEGVVAVPGVLTEKDLGFPGDAPIINSMIRKALPYVETAWLGLVNADVVVARDFLARFSTALPRLDTTCFLTSVRQDSEIGVKTAEDFEEILAGPTTPHQDCSADLFVATKEAMSRMAAQMPDFILGRMCWDNWIHLYFRGAGARCIDASEALRVVHISHGYDHIGDWHASRSIHHNGSLVGNREYEHVHSWEAL